MINQAPSSAGRNFTCLPIMPMQAMEGVAMVVGVWQYSTTAATLLYQETIR